MVTLELPKLSFTQGEPVQMTIRVKNTGSEPVINKRRAEHEFWVQRGEQVIWDSKNRAVAGGGVVSETTLEPGEEWVRTVIWDQQLCNPDGFSEETYAGGPPPPGGYLARAMWRHNPGGWWSNQVEFEIRPAWEGTFWTGLKLRLSLDKAVYRAGEQVTLELLVENTTDKNQAVVTSGCFAGAGVQDQDGRHLGPAYGCPAVVGVVKFRPREQKVFTTTWDQRDPWDDDRPVPPGTYFAFGRLEGSWCPEVADKEDPTYDEYKECMKDDRSIDDHKTERVPFRISA